jgi:TetR/AcrR family transcriptional regulator
VAKQVRSKGNAQWREADTDKVRVKREAVLQTAAKLFNERGVPATSLLDVAQALGVSKSALYYYVSGKDDLVFQAHLQAVERTASFFQMADETGGNGLEKIEIYLRTEIGNEWGATTILSEAVYLDDERRRIIQRKGQENEETFRRFVEEGIADGSISPNSKKLVELAIMGAFCWLPKWYKPEGEHTLPEIAEAFMRVFFDGLRPR